MANENLMIEVVGSSNKATSALDKVIAKLTEPQKIQSQITIASAKAQSAMEKTAFDTENYAFKSEKLAKAREKIDLIITIRIKLEFFSFCRLLKIHINIDF